MLGQYPLSHYQTAFSVVAAVLLDVALGEPKRWHPLVGFGKLAAIVEHRLNRTPSSRLSYYKGLLAWVLLLAPWLLLSVWAWHSPWHIWLDIILLYFAIGAKSLKQHAMRVYQALTLGDIAQARQAVAMMVSRDTSALNHTQIASATVESVLENGSDAIFGAIFWFVLLGGTGALLYRLANTLDAMWGYRNPRFVCFGWAAARLDDVLNLIPARLTALSYAICGHTRSALLCWWRQAYTWYSPNAGPVMAAGAGALQVQLGGNAVYHGVLKQRPSLGLGASASPSHIVAAWRLVQYSLCWWCIFLWLWPLMGSLNFA
jgi:adenosylcobinamide-phosphate synthase